MSDLVFLRSIDARSENAIDDAQKWHPLKQIAVIGACALSCWSVVAAVVFLAKEVLAVCGVV